MEQFDFVPVEHDPFASAGERPPGAAGVVLPPAASDVATQPAAMLGRSLAPNLYDYLTTPMPAPSMAANAAGRFLRPTGIQPRRAHGAMSLVC